MSFVKNLPPENFLKLINNAECFLGNSSAALREGSYLGILRKCRRQTKSKRTFKKCYFFKNKRERIVR